MARSKVVSQKSPRKRPKVEKTVDENVEIPMDAGEERVARRVENMPLTNDPLTEEEIENLEKGPVEELAEPVAEELNDPSSSQNEADDPCTAIPRSLHQAMMDYPEIEDIDELMALAKRDIGRRVIEEHQEGLEILAPHDGPKGALNAEEMDELKELVETPEENPWSALREQNDLPEVTTTYALNATGPNGEVLAQSWDGGKTWKQTPAGEAFNERRQERPPQIFTRRVMAVIEEPNAVLARRVMTPFSVLDRMKVLTGWAPFQAITQLKDQSLDGVICPTLMHTSELEELKRVARSIILDIDAPLDWDEPMRERLFAMLPYCAGVMVPTPLIASKLRPYHGRVFVVPHLLRRALWQNVGTPPIRTVQVAIPTELDTAQESAIELLRERYGDRVKWQSFDWRTLDPLQEALWYKQYDVVVLPVLTDRVQASMAPLLAPMAAQSVVVGDRSWTSINHRDNGLMILRPDAKTWAQELNTVLQDRRLRLRIGRAARGQAMRYCAENKLAQIFLPYRVLVPESEPVQVEEAA